MWKLNHKYIWLLLFLILDEITNRIFDSSCTVLSVLCCRLWYEAKIRIDYYYYFHFLCATTTPTSCCSIRMKNPIVVNGLIGGKKVKSFGNFYYHKIMHALHHDRSKSTRMERYETWRKSKQRKLQKKIYKNGKSFDLLPLINIR